MLRHRLFAALGFAAIATCAAASDAPRGAYASLTTADAAACARACAEDGICMAWSFRAENSCALSAVIATTPDPEALATGASSRAPAFFQSRTPVVQPTSVDTPAQTAPQHLAAAKAEDEPPPPAEDDDTMLLGGPLEGDLRLGLR